jgi:imidazolonepropionase-like amidohydrolase
MIDGLVRVGRLYTGTSEHPLDDAAIGVADGRIEAIGRRADFPADAAVILDLPDATALPGLIDTHLHCELTPVEEFAGVRDAWEADRAAGRLGDVALEHARAALRGGCTTIRDCGSSIELLKVRDAIAGGEVGPRIVATGPPITTSSGQMWWLGRHADDAAAARRITAELVEHGTDAIKVMASGGFLTPGSDPYRPQYDADTLREIVHEAHRHGRMVVAHASDAIGIRHAAAAGADSIEHAQWFGPGGTDGWTEEAAREVAAGTSFVGLSVSGTLRHLSADGDDAALRRRARHHRWHREHGGRVGIHSDAGGHLTRFERFAESVAVGAAALSISARQAIELVTTVAADALGLGLEIGRLAVGYRADILVVDGDPFLDLQSLDRVRAVVRDGRVVVRDGRLLPSEPVMATAAVRTGRMDAR